MDDKKSIRDNFDPAEIYRNWPNYMDMESKKLDIFSDFFPDTIEILDNISELITIQDINMRIVWANMASGQSVNTDRSALIGRKCHEIWHQRDIPCVGCPVVEALKSGRPSMNEIKTPDGRYWNIRSYPIRAKDSSIIGAVELTQDITSRNKAEQALIESEKSYRHLYESSMIGWWRTSIEDGTFLKANMAAVNALGFEIESELIGKYKSTYFYPAEERQQLLKMLKETGQVDRYEAHFTLRDGSQRTVLLSARAYPEKGFVEGSVINITDHKETLEALNRAVNNYSNLYENLRDGAATVNMDGRITECNPAFRKMLGYSNEEISDLTYVDITPPKWHAAEADIINKQVLTTGYSENYEKEYRRKDGTIFPVELRTYLLKDASGKPTGMWAFVRDITELKRAEELLKRSERRYRSLVETITEGMAIVDFDENILFANSAACKIFGYTLEELIGINLRQIILPEDFNKILAETGKRKNGLTSKYEFSIRRRDNQIRHLYISVTPYQDTYGNVEGAIGLFSDVTERKIEKAERQKLKDQLERAQRMESLAILAGGVAHDLNNILGPLVAYPEMILMKLPPDSPARKQIAMLGKSAREAADVIQDLLTLARRGRYEMKPTDINEVIESYLESANLAELKSRNPNILLETALDRNIGCISGSTPHLLKVIMNLVINAFDAMTSGGKLTIKTGQARLDKLYGGLSSIEKGDYIIVRVRDTGIGIEEKNLKYIFEPYYSKKEMGSSGSGLGLSVVYGIVKDHRGYYDVNSTVGVGTEFILYFPLCTTEVERHHDAQDAIGGTETILVIDDVAEQREIARELLSSLGYAVTTVNNGREAINYMSKHSVDIIILDMIMEKDFDGLDTYNNILKYHPSQKAVIVSGFSATERVSQAMELGAGQYIKKPYTLKQLGLAIRKELDKNKIPSHA